MDPGDSDEPSREELESRVAELEANQAEQREWWEEALPSRRGVLTAGAGLGLGALLTGSASGQSAAGQVGTEASPEDVFAFDLDVQGALQRDLDAGGQAIENAGSVSTDDGPNADYHARPEGRSIQEAVNAVPDDADGKAQGRVVVNPKGTRWDETVDLQSHVIVEGKGINTYLRGTGDHTVDVTGQDSEIRRMWIDNSDADTYNAINVAAPEFRAFDVDIDAAGENAVYINDKQFLGRDIHIVGGGIGRSGLKFDSAATQCHVVNYNLNSDTTGTRHGIEINDGANNITVSSLTITATTNNAVFLNGDNCGLSALTVANSQMDGITLGGNANANTITGATVSGSADNALTIFGSNNYISGTFGGDVVLESGASGNTVVGVTSGTLTDKGIDNDTSGLNET